MNGAWRRASAARWALGATLVFLLPGWAAATDHASRCDAAAQEETTATFSAQRVDGGTGTALSSRIEADGRTVSTMSVGPLRMTKTVKSGGEIAIDLHDGLETIRIEIGRERLIVASDGAMIEVHPAKASADDYERIRRVLGRSSALATVHTVAVFLDDDSVRSFEGLSFLVAQTILATLGGDAAAPRRLSQLLLQKAPATGPGFIIARLDSCFLRWKYEVVEAFDWVEGCYHDFPWWNVPARQLCFFEWTLRVEFAWAELLRCTAMNPPPM
jgi:hypothetical protein